MVQPVGAAERRADEYSWRDRLASWPRAARAASVFVVGAIVASLLRASQTVGSGDETVLELGLRGVAYGAGMALVSVLIHRRERAAFYACMPGARRSISRALRTGEPPEDPEFDRVILPLLTRRRDQIRVSTSLLFVIGAVCVLWTVEALVQHSVKYLAWAAIGVAGIVYTVVSNRCSTRRLDGLGRLMAARAGRTSTMIDEPERDDDARWDC